MYKKYLGLGCGCFVWQKNVRCASISSKQRFFFFTSSSLAACSSVVLRESVSLSGEEVIGSNPVRPTKGDEYVLEGGSSVGRALGSSSWIRYPLEQKYLEVTSSTLVLSAKTYLFFLEPLSMSEGFFIPSTHCLSEVGPRKWYFAVFDLCYKIYADERSEE